ncbi:MAG: hypothetical protein KAW45_05745 [Thermoplasmatales archaeon]|nr:hypothetical protein [Thermoplasmatales archaeon]
MKELKFPFRATTYHQFKRRFLIISTACLVPALTYMILGLWRGLPIVGVLVSFTSIVYVITVPLTCRFYKKMSLKPTLKKA